MTFHVTLLLLRHTCTANVLINTILNFIALHLQDGFSHEQNVCPFVKRVNCDKTKETSAEILTAYKRPIHLVF